MYECTDHVARCSDVCERLFSRASLVMTPNRKQMDPSTLEMILMLRTNMELWDATTIQQIMDSEKDAARQRRDQIRTPSTTSSSSSSSASIRVATPSNHELDSIYIDEEEYIDDNDYDF